MSDSVLLARAQQLTAPGRGILAIDESHGTCEKRFTALGVECNEATRQHYRQLLVTAPGLENSLNGMILFDETLRQSTQDGKTFVECLSERGIGPIIKVDQGTTPLNENTAELVTNGLDGLPERLQEYSQLGAIGTKWRAVITIDKDKGWPTNEAIEANTTSLARYAKIVQEADMVPMIEPEILYDGTHSIDACRQVCERVWTDLFAKLKEHNVNLSAVILKTSMVLNGRDSGQPNAAPEVAKETIEALKATVPAEVAGVVFLSGGLTDTESTVFLNEMNKSYETPWPVSFSYGRGIQGPALKLWTSNPEGNYDQAQKVLAHRATMNALAAQGKYDSNSDTN